MIGFIDIQIAEINAIHEYLDQQTIKRFKKLEESLKFTHDLMKKIDTILVPTLTLDNLNYKKNNGDGGNNRFCQYQ